MEEGLFINAKCKKNPIIKFWWHRPHLLFRWCLLRSNRKSLNLHDYKVVTDWVTKIGFLGTRNQPKYGLKQASWARLFFIFGIFWWFFFIVEHAEGGQKMKKRLVKLAFLKKKKKKHFSTALPKYKIQVSSTRPITNHYAWYEFFLVGRLKLKNAKKGRISF